MSKDAKNSPNGSSKSPDLSFQDLSINSSPRTDLSISTVSGSNNCSTCKASDIGVEEKDVVHLNEECEGSEKTSLSSSSFCYSVDPNEARIKTYCPSKPHKANDIRWDAIQSVKAKDGELSLSHFRLLKKLGFGDIGSVYLAELRGMGCLFAVKVMDKGMLVGRKKLIRAQTEREILGLLDHPFLPTLYSHFETEKLSCLLMEFCSGGDLHILRQRQSGKHFSEQAARFNPSSLSQNIDLIHILHNV